jgi:hypothetical protein
MLVMNALLVVFPIFASANEHVVDRNESAKEQLGQQIYCPPAPSTVKMGPRDWCVLNCSSQLTYNVDFGKSTFGTNTGNVEIVDDENYEEFLAGSPFFHYQEGSMTGVQIASAHAIDIRGPIVIIQCQNVATSCSAVKIKTFECQNTCSSGGDVCPPTSGMCCGNQKCYPCPGGTCCEITTTGQVVGCCQYGTTCCGTAAVPSCCGYGAECCRVGVGAGGCCPAGSYCCTTSPTGCCSRETGEASEQALPGIPRTTTTYKPPDFMKIKL